MTKPPTSRINRNALMTGLPIAIVAGIFYLGFKPSPITDGTGATSLAPTPPAVPVRL